MKKRAGGNGYVARARLGCRAGALMVLALLAGCGGGDEGARGVGEGGPETAAGGLNTSPAGTPSCEGDLVPEQPSGFGAYGYFGETRLLHRGNTDVQEQSLLTGEVKQLFDLADGRFVLPLVAADDRDVFAQDNSTIYRYSRATGNLSVFAKPPAAGEVPTLAGDLRFLVTLGLSDTNVFTLLYDAADLNVQDLSVRRAYVAVYDRATAALRTFPALAPMEQTVLLAPWNQRLLQIRAVDIIPDPGISGFAGSVAVYDTATGAVQPFLESPNTLTKKNYAFWGDDFVAVMAPEGGPDRQLVRVPLSGGARTVLVGDVSEQDLAVLGDKAYVTLSVPDPGGGSHPQLTEVDLAGGSTTPVGSCQGKAFYATDASLLVSDPRRGALVRLRR